MNKKNIDLACVYGKNREFMEDKTMGTRHLTVIVKDNKIKLSQYGQWDGYYEGQGVTFTNFVREKLTSERGLNRFNENVDLLKNTDEETHKKYVELWEEMNKNKEFLLPYNSTLPQFSRDTGTEILNIIFNLSAYDFDERKYPIYIEEDSSWCEFIYCINLDTNEVYMLTNHSFSPSQVKETCELIKQKYKGFDCWYKSTIKDLPSVENIQQYYDLLFNCEGND